MTLGEKIIRLRKQMGWSQEELAQQLDVSRQSVSKWEGNLSSPDLDKLLLLSKIFDVSTDHLLKDDEPQQPTSPLPAQPEPPKPRRVTLAQAEEFIAVKRRTGPWIAFATVLCILSPIPLFLLSALSEYGRSGLSELAAAGTGMCILLAFCAAAVAIYLSCGAKTKPFAYFETEPFEAEPAMQAMAEAQRAAYYPIYSRCCILGTCICILSVIPLFLTIAVAGENEMALISALAALMAVCAIAVALFIVSGVRMAAYEKLLQEGEYTPEEKLSKKKYGKLAAVYWPVIVAVYLGYSFITGDWEKSWVVWPVAALIYVALSAALWATRSKRSS